jgi:hypothetical protein
MTAKGESARPFSQLSAMDVYFSVSCKDVHFTGKKGGSFIGDFLTYGST